MHVRVDHLVGQLRDKGKHNIGQGGGGGSLDEGVAPAFYVVGQLCAFGEVLGLPARAPIAQARSDGCSWGSILSFPLKVRKPAFEAVVPLAEHPDRSLMRA